MTVLDFKKRKTENRKISMVTAYDFWTARIIEKSPVDCVLVGDSVAMVVHGHPSTVSATNKMMALHTQSVARAIRTKFLIADMPFGSFRSGKRAAISNVDLLIKAGAQAVKLEGVWGHEAVIDHIVESGVPVVGHIGLTPQSIHKFGGFKVQGKAEGAAKDLRKQATRLEELGCCMVVLECIPSELAAEITTSLKVPTIGIGAGASTDGQVLVLQDLLGMNQDFKPKFLRHFMTGEKLFSEAIRQFHMSVIEGQYPLMKESYESDKSI